MANVTPSTPSSPDRAARLEELKAHLQEAIDEIVRARADRQAALKKDFDEAWAELKHEVDRTTH
jgi:hypothetical protein